MEKTERGEERRAKHQQTGRRVGGKGGLSYGIDVVISSDAMDQRRVYPMDTNPTIYTLRCACIQLRRKQVRGGPSGEKDTQSKSNGHFSGRERLDQKTTNAIKLTPTVGARITQKVKLYSLYAYILLTLYPLNYNHGALFAVSRTVACSYVSEGRRMVPAVQRVKLESTTLPPLPPSLPAHASAHSPPSASRAAAVLIYRAVIVAVPTFEKVCMLPRRDPLALRFTRNSPATPSTLRLLLL